MKTPTPTPPFERVPEQRPHPEQEPEHGQRRTRIRERAHELWEQAGRPDGRNEEFWHRAEQEVQLEEEH